MELGDVKLALDCLEKAINYDLNEKRELIASDFKIKSPMLSAVSKRMGDRYQNIEEIITKKCFEPLYDNYRFCKLVDDIKNTYGDSGISYNLTQQMQQYGKGTYTLTFEAKAKTATRLQVDLGINNQSKSSTTKSLTTNWQSITITFNNTTSPSSITNGFLRMICKSNNVEIDIRNAKLVYNG